MLHRIREMVRVKNPEKLSGVVEADETHMARKFRNDFKDKAEKEAEYLAKSKYKNKGVVIGMIERQGKIIVKALDSNNAENIRGAIQQNVEPNSTLYTDESFLYGADLDEYKQGRVYHSKKRYVEGDVHTNNVENFWSVMKRGIYGTYHQISFKHLSRYCDEFSFRYNSRTAKDNDRFGLSLIAPQGQLKYSQLIAK